MSRRFIFRVFKVLRFDEMRWPSDHRYISLSSNSSSGRRRDHRAH